MPNVGHREELAASQDSRRDEGDTSRPKELLLGLHQAVAHDGDGGERKRDARHLHQPSSGYANLGIQAARQKRDSGTGSEANKGSKNRPEGEPEEQEARDLSAPRRKRQR